MDYSRFDRIDSDSEEEREQIRRRDAETLAAALELIGCASCAVGARSFRRRTSC